jgi:hypothetical protein
MLKESLMKDAEMILKAHPDKIPVLISKYPSSRLKDLNKNKYQPY